MDRTFLLAILNSATADESLQIAAYNLLNVTSYRLTERELVDLVTALLTGRCV